jgi:hypothetical protein
MWTAIWTVLAFLLLLAALLFLGEPTLAFLAEQLHERRTHRLQLERERTKQAMLAFQRDATVWQQLNHVNSSYQSSDFKSEQVSDLLNPESVLGETRE